MFQTQHMSQQQTLCVQRCVCTFSGILAVLLTLIVSIIAQSDSPSLSLSVPPYSILGLPRVELVSNKSTVALRVVGGDEKGTQCLGI
jgi:hypothetical protein